MGKDDGGHGRPPFYNITAKGAVDAQSFILISSVGMVFGAVFPLRIEN